MWQLYWFVSTEYLWDFHILLIIVGVEIRIFNSSPCLPLVQWFGALYFKLSCPFTIKKTHLTVKVEALHLFLHLILNDTCRLQKVKGSRTEQTRTSDTEGLKVHSRLTYPDIETFPSPSRHASEHGRSWARVLGIQHDGRWGGEELKNSGSTGSVLLLIPLASRFLLDLPPWSLSSLLSQVRQKI